MMILHFLFQWACNGCSRKLKQYIFASEVGVLFDNAVESQKGQLKMLSLLAERKGKNGLRGESGVFWIKLLQSS